MNSSCQTVLSPGSRVRVRQECEYARCGDAVGEVLLVNERPGPGLYERDAVVRFDVGFRYRVRLTEYTTEVGELLLFRTADLVPADTVIDKVQTVSHLTRVVLEDGTVEPRGDFEGRRLALVEVVAQGTVGHPVRWDAALCDALGGYQKGDLVIHADGGLLMSSVDYNTADPDGQFGHMWQKIAGVPAPALIGYPDGDGGFHLGFCDYDFDRRYGR